jgi:translation initiation factor IF-2
MNLKTLISGPAEGTVIEARMNKKIGPVATLLVQKGTLRVGDLMLTGSSFGRIKKIISTGAEAVELAEAGPSTPVHVSFKIFHYSILTK